MRLCSKADDRQEKKHRVYPGDLPMERRGQEIEVDAVAGEGCPTARDPW